jgi:hypothetical protein
VLEVTDMKSLTDLVNIYNKNVLGIEDWQLSDFKRRNKPIADMIEDAVYGYLPDRKRDSHQRRISKETLDKMVSILRERKYLEELEKSKTFDGIFTIVYVLSVPNFRELCVYDTALRLGAYLNLYPEVVYLHRGTLEGAKYLLGDAKLKRMIKYFSNDKKFPYVAKEVFPEELQKLKPYHIENFLCHMKDRIPLLKNNNTLG